MKKIVASALLALAVFAQPAFPADDGDGLDIEYSFGTVKAVLGSQITITEYDYEKDRDLEVIYELGGAKLENAGSLSEIGENDTVDLVYRRKNGKRVVINASFEKSGAPSGLDL